MSVKRNTASNTVISGTADADSIVSVGDSVTVNAGAGDDTVYSKGSPVSINGGAGNNFISLASDGYLSVIAGTGNDTVHFGDDDELAEQQFHNFASISGGNNYISNAAELSTIVAGAGNDTIITDGGEKVWGNVYDRWEDLYVSVVAGAGDNQITVSTYMKEGKINAKGGADLVSIVGSDNSTINVGAGDNSITLNGNGSGNSIVAGKGNDYVSMEAGSSGNEVLVGNGNNTVYSEGKSHSVWSGDGDDFITLGSGYVSAGGGKNNVFFTESGYSTVIAGTGNDTVHFGDDDETAEQQYHNLTSISGGNNYIFNDAELSTISTGAGNDTIITGGGEKVWGNVYDRWEDLYVSVVAGAGDNQITVSTYMKEGKINAKDGNDTVLTAESTNSTINVGNGNNIVSIGGGGSGNNIVAGKGNDLVSMVSSSSGNVISVGSGNNTVYGAGDNQSVWAGDDDNIITIGSGYVNVGNGKNNVSVISNGYNSVIAGNGDDTINVGDNRSETAAKQFHNRISVSGGNNYISNAAELSTIEAGDGNDTIITGGGEKTGWDDGYGGNGRSGGWSTSIVAGAGDNQIVVTSYVSNGDIIAKDGNDVVSIESADNSLINVGAGANTIIADNTLNDGNTFTAGKGSDVFFMSGKNNFVNAGSGRNNVSLNGGQNNTIVTGAGDDSITLGDNASGNVIVFGGGSDLVLNYRAGDTVAATGSLTQATVGSDIVLSDGNGSMTLQGAAGKIINTEILASSSDAYKALAADKTIGDITIPGLTTATALNINNTVNNTLITGTAYDDTVTNSGSTVTINAGKGDDSVNTKGDSVTVDLGAGDDYIYKTTGDFGTYDAGAGNDTITGDYIVSTLLGGAGDDLLKVDLVYLGNNAAIPVLDAGDGNDTIVNNGYGIWASVNAGAGDDFINVGDYHYDKTTILGGAGNDTMYGSHGIVFEYSSGDGNDLIYNFGKEDNLRIGNGTGTYSTQTSGSDVIVTVGDGSITLSGAASLSAVKITGTYKNPLLITGTASADSIKTTLDGATVRAYGGNDTIRAYGDDTSIDGGAGNDSIRSYGDNVTILGNAGNDSVRNYGDNVTIKGGTGNDTLLNYGNNVLFTHAAGEGNDVIMGFNETSTLSISGDTYSTQVSGNNVVVTAGTSKIILTGAAKLDTVNISGKQDSSTTLTLTDADDAKVTIPSSIASADTSARTTAIQITGNALDNSILGGAGNDNLLGNAGDDYLSGGSGDDYVLGGAGNDKLYGYTGNDTLIGGAGNDSLWGQAGADTFVYNSGDGKDMIFGFDDSDMLQITGNWTASYYSGSGRVGFKVGNTYSAIILDSPTASTFNINGDSYVISGNTLVKK